MATVETRKLTADEFNEFLDRPENQGKRWELEKGEIIEMPPPGEFHGVVCFLVVHLLGEYLFRRKRGYLCSNDAGLLVARGPDTVRGPDVMLFDENRPLESMSRTYTDRIPKLIVEVLSPNDQQTKTNRRITQYLKRGVPLVWLLDPEMRSISIYRRGREMVVVDETEAITGEDALPDLQFQVAEFFRMPDQ